jgi:hypothetical protein
MNDFVKMNGINSVKKRPVLVSQALSAIWLAKDFQYFMQPEFEMSRAVFKAASLTSHQCDHITHLLTLECLQVLVTQGPPSLLFPLVVQEALFHQVDQAGPTKQSMLT